MNIYHNDSDSSGYLIITLGRNSQQITGCPEALHQLRLFSPERKYLGRIGFNIHLEQGDLPIMSITNMQGIPDGRSTYMHLGINPFDILLDQAKGICQEMGVSAIRGIKNPLVHPELYNTVFKRHAIHRASAPKVGRYNVHSI